MLRAALTLLLTLPLSATPLKILAAGDSLTDEYAFSFPFNSADSNPGVPNIQNWTELLVQHRATEASFGAAFSPYPDRRIGGYELNFGFVGFTTFDYLEVVTSDQITDPYFTTRAALISEIPNADVAVIFLGGNDLKNDYDDILENTEPPVGPRDFYEAIVHRISLIHTWIRIEDPSMPIVLCTVPDVGATPEIEGTFGAHPNFDGARAKIAQLNDDIAALAAGLSNTTVARIDQLTDRVFDDDPFHLNGTLFTIEGDPENPPDHVFSKDDFHPATPAQALIANEIMAAINELTGSSLTPFSDREILDDLLGLDPDQPYLDWIGGFSVADASMSGDSDLDRLPNLIEMALGTPPDQFSSPLSGNFDPSSGLSWTPDPIAARYVDLFAQESGNLAQWDAVPAERLSENAGTITATPPAGESHHFGRLKTQPR
ncbi:MAG: SGNH/GDSL hydrolase family protein [Verrucomicrobiota bacterium]